jgi:hypothetical protein
MYSGVTQQAKYARLTMRDKSSSIEYQGSFKRTSVHHRAIIPAIYPALNGMNIWQSHKSNVNLAGPYDVIFDRWIIKLHKDERICQQVLSDGNHILKNVHDKYFDITKDGTKNLKYFVKYFKFGHESQFVLDPTQLNSELDYDMDFFKAEEFIY